MKDNIIEKKSFAFAKRIVKLYIYLKDVRKEFVLSKQVLRSGTAIGAIIEESIGGQSQKDFISKISIAYKEARETSYWLRLLVASEMITTEQYSSLKLDIDELLRILGKIQITMKARSLSRNS